MCLDHSGAMRLQNIQVFRTDSGLFQAFPHAGDIVGIDFRPTTNREIT